jgi:hypothetical protein
MISRNAFCLKIADSNKFFVRVEILKDKVVWTESLGDASELNMFFVVFYKALIFIMVGVETYCPNIIVCE